ncbi:MAG TPA: hypothetical protein VK034_09505, partial [Enhygromyxa sp.]|nr:hypothetical protein [Enhygromyxa sp.]
MIELLRKASSPIAVTLTLALGLVPLDRAHASEPGFAEPPPPQPEGVDESSGQPLRIVADEPPAPALELEPAPAYQPAPEIRTVDSPRPRPGTGLIALGAIGMGASAAMMITGLAGPGWANLERQQAAIIGGMSLPIGLASMAMVVGGSRVNRKYQSWADRNAITPPSPGNGILVGGAVVTALGVAGLGGGIQLAITDPTPSRSNWALVAGAGAVTAIGLAVLCSGMITRSKFAAWERKAQLVPGTM